MEKRCKKAWMEAPFFIFWTLWLERNGIAFDNEDISVHRMISYFPCNFVSWKNLYIVERPR